ncbi:MAG: WD40 repeat domain-containing protein [Chloroflexi bacterium]|nr:WD40 repeat domain-containing protein [Chloroflexota bacterium]
MNRTVILTLIAGLWGLAGCGAPPAGPTPTPEGAGPRNLPTLVAPPWTESAGPVDLATIQNIAYLGRLDLPERPSTIFAVAVSPDGTRLAGLNAEELLAWDLLTGELVFRTARAEATRIFYAPDKTELYALSIDGQLNVVDAETGAVVNRLAAHTAYSGSFSFDGLNNRLALGGDDGTVKVWDLFERQSLVTIDAHDGRITALAFGPEGDQLVTGGGDRTVAVWDWAARAALATLTLDAVIAAQVAVAPDGAQIAVGTETDAILWAVAADTTQSLTIGGTDGATQILAYAPDGGVLMAGGRTVGLSLWNPATAELIGRLPDMTGERLSATFSPDGDLLLTAVFGEQVALWNLVDSTADALSQAALSLGTAEISDVYWTADGRLLLFFDAAGPIYVWGIGPTPTPMP